jgi:hypothetical protein
MPLARIAGATLVAAVAAVVANVLLRALAVAVLDIPQPEFEPLQVRAVVVSTLGGVIAAGGVFAILARRARDPARVFVIVATVALVVSLWAPISLAVADPPENPGTDAGSVGTLVVMHVVAAAIAVGVLIAAAARDAPAKGANSR